MEIIITSSHVTCSRHNIAENPIKEEFEDAKGLIRIRKSRSTDNTMTKRKQYKRTNNDIPNIYRYIKLTIE